MIGQTGRARFQDAPSPIDPPAPDSERIVGVYPGGGRYRIELRGDVLVLLHRLDADPATADAGAQNTLEEMNRRNREFWNQPRAGG